MAEERWQQVTVRRSRGETGCDERAAAAAARQRKIHDGSATTMKLRAARHGPANCGRSDTEPHGTTQHGTQRQTRAAVIMGA